MSAVSFERACADSVAAMAAPGGATRFDRLDIEAPGTLRCGSEEFLTIPGSALERLSHEVFGSIQFRLRSGFIRDLARMAQDSGGRERFVLETLLDNARIAAAGTFPLCQDTGTAGVYAWKGDRIITSGDLEDQELLARGTLAAWNAKKLRNSQLAPLGMYEEKNTGNNSPLACDIFSQKGSSYRFLFLAKGGGSSNKTALYQETKDMLQPGAFKNFLANAIMRLGVSACPPYAISVVVGGQSPEQCLMAAKLAGTGALDAMPTAAQEGSPFRDLETEALVMRLAEESGWGAQFGGRFMARSARVIRLSRHAASLPVAIAVSCAAHRQAFALVNRDGFFLEHLCGAAEIEEIITSCPKVPAAEGKTRPVAEKIATREIHLGNSDLKDLRAGELVSLHGTVVLVRDAAHARLRALLAREESLPAWTSLPAYYASPTETPEGAILGSLGPTTAKRMDAYQDELMSRGAFKITIGKGERGAACSEACKKFGGVYFAAIGGAAAVASASSVKAARVIDWPELGMEAVREVELCGLPALVAVDSGGVDFYAPGFAR